MDYTEIMKKLKANKNSGEESNVSEETIPAEQKIPTEEPIVEVPSVPTQEVAPTEEPSGRLSLRELMAKSNELKQASLDQMREANADRDKKTMVNNLLSLVGPAAANFAQAQSGIVIKKPDGAKTRKMLNDQVNQAYKGKISEINAERDAMKEKVKNFSTEEALEGIDPDSKLSDTGRLLLASQLGPEKMRELEEQGIDFSSMSYDRAMKLAGQLGKQTAQDKQEAKDAKDNIKAKKSAEKESKEDKKFWMKQELGMRNKVDTIFQQIRGFKRGGQVQKKMLLSHLATEDALDTMKGFASGQIVATPQNVAELESQLSTILRGGSATEGSEKRVSQDSLQRDMAKIKQYMSGNPTEALPQPLLENLHEMINRENTFYKSRLTQSEIEAGRRVSNFLSTTYGDTEPFEKLRGEFNKLVANPLTDKELLRYSPERAREVEAKLLREEEEKRTRAGYYARGERPPLPAQEQHKPEVKQLPANVKVAKIPEDEKVKVISPDGQMGYVRKSKIESILKQGFKLAE